MTTEYQRMGKHLPHEVEAIVKEYAQPRYKKPLTSDLDQEIRIRQLIWRHFEEKRYYKLCDYFDYTRVRVRDGITSFSRGWTGPRGNTIFPVRCNDSCPKCNGSCYRGVLPLSNL